LKKALAICIPHFTGATGVSRPENVDRAGPIGVFLARRTPSKNRHRQPVPEMRQVVVLRLGKWYYNGFMIALPKNLSML
jgi:hypothetical protein